MMRWIRQHRGPAAGLGAAGIVGIVVVLVWFRPQGLLFDQRVDETIPGLESLDETAPTTSSSTTAPSTTSTTAATDDGAASTTAATTSTTTTTTMPTTTTTEPGPVVLSDSQLIEVGRAGTGRVLVIELPDGNRVVRFEDLDVVNGPDLVVILSPSALVTDRELYDDGDFISLGDLKGNQGNQNYEIPADVDLSQFGTVAIWCRRFNYTFNAAEIIQS